MERQRANSSYDIYCENKTYKLKKSIPFCNTLLSEMKFPEMYHSCDKNENNISVLVLPRCIPFLRRSGVKIKWQFFSSNSETSPFCLLLRSGIIALLDILICSLLARRSDFALRIANKLAYLQRKCILRKLTKKKSTSSWSKINQVSTCSLPRSRFRLVT